MEPWRKIGSVAGPVSDPEWAGRHRMLPTPWAIEPDRLRIYLGATDSENHGRVAFVDVDGGDPHRLLGHSVVPALGPGPAGTFSDAGVVPSAIVPWLGWLLLFYSGFQRAVDVPYRVFTGVAVSEDGGNRFSPASPGPVLGPSAASPDFRAGAFVLPDGPRFRMWYLASLGWETLAGGKRVPRYRMEYLESGDPFRWGTEGVPCLEPDAAKGETGFSRPWVAREAGAFRMWFAVRRRIAPERVAYTHIEEARSPDGVRWERRGSVLERSAAGWDSEMVCYPAIFRRRLFYCGNDHGRGGFGYAEARGEVA